MEQPEVIVVGGGAIGMAVAWRLGQAGHSVLLLERGDCGRAASWAAAGMLAPDAEIGFEELDLYRLNRESLRRWPRFAEDLERATGRSLGYRTEGTLVVASDRDDAEALRRLYHFQREQDVTVEWLTPDEALDREPFLAPRLTAAVFAPGDHQVDNRALVQALHAALAAMGNVAVREHVFVESLIPDASVPEVVLEGGERIAARVVTVAAGAWSRGLDGLEPKPSVRPKKGQALALKMDPPFRLRHTVRGPDAYLVPKADGRLVIGATSEEQGFDTRVTAGGLYRLLEGAVEVVPGVEELDVMETWAGLRPASRDHAPLLGEAAPGVVLATGHYRHGILLTPVTADEIAAEVQRLLTGAGETSPWLDPFSPRRFSQPVSP